MAQFVYLGKPPRRRKRQTIAFLTKTAGPSLIVGASTLTFASTSILSGTTPAVGTSSLTFASTSTLAGLAPAIGTAAHTYTVATATLTGSGAVTGTSAHTYTVANATLTGAGAVTGTSPLAFTTTGTIAGLAPATGTSALTFASTSALTGGGAVTGTSSLTFATTGSMVLGSIIGTTSLTFAFGGGTQATLDFDSYDLDTGAISDNGFYTFSMTGADATGQERLVFVSGISNGSTADFDACTIDGETATRVASLSQGAIDGFGNRAFTTAYRAPGTANTSFNVVVLSDGAMYSGYCACYLLSNAGTLLDSVGSSVDSPTLDVDTATNGTVAASAFGYPSSGDMTAVWSGLTENYDDVSAFVGDDFTGASEDITSGGETPRAVSIDFTPDATGTNASISSLILSFNPQAAAGDPTLIGTGELVGTSPLAFTPTSTLAGSIEAVGTTSLTFSLTGTMDELDGAIDGTVSFTFGPTGTLAGTAAGVGASTLTFALTGVMVEQDGAIDGTTTLTFAPTSTLTGAALATGASTLTFASTTTLGGFAFGVGPSTLTFGTTSTLVAGGILIGPSTLIFAEAATLAGTIPATGTSVATFTTTGTLTDVTVTLPFLDPFTRADQALEASQFWTHDTLVASGATIVSNKLKANTTNATGTAYQCPSQGSPNHYVQFTLEDVTSVAGPHVANRLTDVNNFVGVRYDGVGGNWEVHRRVGGAFTTLATIASPDPVVGDTVRLECEFTEWKLKLNGALIGSGLIGDASLTSTRQGVVARTTVINSWIDNFEAGPLNTYGNMVSYGITTMRLSLQLGKDF